MAETTKSNKNFFKDFKVELKRVIWPTKKQTIKNTLAVIFLVILVSLTVVVLDLVFRKGYDFAVDKATGGTISQVNKIFKEMKDYTDENTINLYKQFYGAGYIDLEGLNSALEEMKNPKPENASGNDIVPNEAVEAENVQPAETPEENTVVE